MICKNCKKTYWNVFSWWWNEGYCSKPCNYQGFSDACYRIFGWDKR